MSFNNFIDNKNDSIDCIAFDLLCLLATSKEELREDEDPPISWDVYRIGRLVEFAEELLSEKDISTCHPFFEGDDKIPCYLGKDCKRTDCIFRKGGSQ